MIEPHPRLTALERREKHKIYLRDTAALSTLAGIVVALSFMTYGLFHSFASHRTMLENRWRQRGEAALAQGQPLLALDDLHSALAYAPGDRGLEIELATALAAAGRTQEAQVYFTTLLESEPGSGLINLQLARLAIQQGNTETAIEHYQAAIDGTWNGDAFARRREIRLELARFLIAQRRFPEARNLLLITSGNGPDNYGLQLTLGALLEQAQDPADALDVYRKAVKNRSTRLEALEGEGHAAAALGRFAQARAHLAEAAGEPAFARQPEATREGVRAEIETANRVLALYPADTLAPTEQARRIGYAAKLAQARLLGCAPGSPEQKPAPASPAPLLSTLGTDLQRLNPLANKAAAPPASPPTGSSPSGDQLSTLRTQWAALRTGAALERQLAADPVFAHNTLALVYATERAVAKACGSPEGDDALLLRMGETPDQVEAQP